MMNNDTIRFDGNRRGATIVLMLFLLVVVFIFVAFAVDVGRIQLAQLKLQTSADLASRAGAEAMARGVGDTTDLADFESAIRDECNMLMQKNNLFGAAVSFDAEAQINFGVATVAAAGNGNGNANGNGNNGNGNGNGKSKFQVDRVADGTLQFNSNSVSVSPDIAQFPLVFGKLLGRDNVALGSFATAKVQERDIVFVVDRSASMLDHDAGFIPVSQYPVSLFDLEDQLYDDTSVYWPEDASDNRHSEFEIVGTDIKLSKMQAMKLALLRFRQRIAETPGDEQLALVSYYGVADSPDCAGTSNVTIDVEAGIPPTVVQELVSSTNSCFASDLESGGYENFDYNYLGMRCEEQTDIAAGINQGVEILFGAGSRTVANPVLLVMTDGRSTAGSSKQAAEAAMAAHPNLQIFTITFGDNADQGEMEDVADAGKGKHYHAVFVEELVRFFQEIAASAGVTVIE